MLAPVSEAIPSERPLLELGLASAHAYPSFVAELRDASVLDPGYLACGTLVAARDGDEAAALTRELEIRRGLGLRIERLRASEARRLEPALAPDLRLALEVPGDRAVDPRRLTAALAEAAGHAGAQLWPGTEVAEVAIAHERVEGVRLAGPENVSAEQVVLAAGAWCNEVGGIPDEARIQVRPVKGQILGMHDPAGPGLLTRVLRMSGGYLVPRGDGRYVLGGTVEERGFDTTVTAGAVFELLRDAIELVPSLSELVLDELHAGLRPGTPDNAPAIGPGAVSGLHWATGHYRGGVLLAPLTADIVTAGLTGEEPPELAVPFSPQRLRATAEVGV